MPLQDAVRFIELAGSDPSLRCALEEGAELLDLPALVRLGAGLDLHFTAGELSVAFARDTAMRRAFFVGRDRSQPPEDPPLHDSQR